MKFKSLFHYTLFCLSSFILLSKANTQTLPLSDNLIEHPETKKIITPEIVSRQGNTLDPVSQKTRGFILISDSQ